MNRVLAIVAIVIVLVGAGVAAYFYFFSDALGVVVAPDGSSLPVAGQGAPLPGEEEGVGGVGTPATTTQNTSTTVSARLVKISSGPIVPGMVATTKSATSSSETVVSYIERVSGNVFTYSTRTKTITRTSNKTIPGIQTASWLPDGSLAFVRYLSGEEYSVINTYGLPAKGTNGFYLSQNLTDVAVSASNVITVASGVNGSIASLERTNGSRVSGIFTTPLTSIRTSFLGKSQYLVFTKPSATLEGSAFTVDSTGRFSRVAGPHQGLVALASPSGKWVLVSYVLDGVMQMKLVQTATGESLALPVATIADKCVWSATDSTIYCGIPKNQLRGVQYPDDWYQGAVHFSDRVWKIDVASRYAQLVLDFDKETDTALDAEALTLDPSSTNLVFVNKNDGSLWGYSL